MSNDSAPGRLAGTSTVPANRKHLEGDFSDLLLLPSGAGANTPAGHHQYQIFDPLTTRPDPDRPGRVIRTPFPGNIIPRDRFMNANGTYKNPMFGLYQAMVPAPNQNFLSPTQQPVNNYYRAAEPDQPHNIQFSSARGLQPLRELPLLLPRQRQQIRGVVAGRLDLRLARSAVRGPARRVAGAVQLVGDRHVDEDARRAHRHRHAGFRQPRPSARHAQEHGQLPAHVGGAAVVHGRLLPGAIRVHPAAQQPQLVRGHGRHGRRRDLGDDVSGAVEFHAHARVAHLARWRRSADGPAHQPGRRREHGDVQLRQSVHPRGRHDHGHSRRSKSA